MAIDRKAMKKQLQQRTNESNKKKDADSNVQYEKYLELPNMGEDTFPAFSMFKKASEVGKRVEQFFNIVPFAVGKKYPTVDYSYKEGEWTYFLDLWIHVEVGPENKRVVCPKRNYNKKCPICEHREERLKDATTKDERREIYKELSPKRRSVYFVRVSEDGEMNEEYNKGVQVMDAPYPWMEQELQREATLPRGGGIVTYASDNEEGKEIVFYVTKKGEGFYDVEGHKLLDRDYIISDEELEQTFPLDECIKLYPYDKLSAIYWGEDEVDDVDDDHPDSDFKDEDFEDPNGDGTGDDVPNFTPPVDDEEDEEEMSCPVGGKLGIDFDAFEDCDSCDLDTDCMMEQRKIKRAEKAKVKEKVAKPTPRKRPSRPSDE